MISNLWALVVMQAFQGAVMSWVEVGVNTLTVWIWKDKVSPYMQLLHFAFGLGLSAFPMLAAVVNSSGSKGGESSGKAFQISYWAMSIFVLLTALFPFILKSPPIEKGMTDHTPVVRSNNREVEKDKTIKASTEVSPEKRQKIRYYLIVASMTVFLLLYGGAENAFGGWAASYAHEFYGLKEVQADELDSVFWIAITIGRLLSVPLASKLSTRLLLAIDLGGGLITVLLLTFLAHFKKKILLWISTVVLGLCMASIYGAAFTVPTELKVKLSGKAASAFIVAAGIGDVGIPPIVGAMLKIVGEGALVYTLVGLLSICVMVYIFVYSYGLSTMEKRLDEMELQELSQLDDQWAFSYVPLIGRKSIQSPQQRRLEFS